MTYQMLYAGCYTSEGKELADVLRHMFGFQTEAYEGDIDEVNTVDIKAMGGAE